MDFLDNYFKNFLKNQFGSDYQLTASKWNAKILWVNLKIGSAYAVVSALGSMFMLFILALLFSISIPLKIYLWIGIIIGGITMYYKYQESSDFITVPNGFYALINILGQRQGGLEKEKPWQIDEGEYRNIIKIPTYNNIFSAVLIPKKVSPLNFVSDGHKTKEDGVPWRVETAGFPTVIDPWAYSERILSTSQEDFESYIREIIVGALDTSLDEFTAFQLLGEMENASKKLKENFYKILGKNHRCSTATGTKSFSGKYEINSMSEEEQENPNVFYIKSTGLAIKFIITNFIPPKEIQDKYNEQSVAKIEKEITITKAEGIAEKKKLEGIADNDVEADKIKKKTEATTKAYTNSVEEMRTAHNDKLTEEALAQKASQAADLVDNEYRHLIEGPNGTSFSLINLEGKSDNSLVSILTILANKAGITKDMEKFLAHISNLNLTPEQKTERIKGGIKAAFEKLNNN